LRDLSLHLLDVIENSLRAGATVVSVTAALDRQGDLFTLSVEDNGPGLNVLPEVATDPFYTTKGGKRVGLGLALLKEAAERAGGRLVLGRSALGGAVVTASMQASHVDRSPLGDVASTLGSVVCTNPEIDIRLLVRVDGQEWSVRSSDAAAAAPDARRGLALAASVSELAKNALKHLTL
jgi:two-component sensor histidine kinase